MGDTSQRSQLWMKENLGEGVGSARAQVAPQVEDALVTADTTPFPSGPSTADTTPFPSSPFFKMLHHGPGLQGTPTSKGLPRCMWGTLTH